MKPSEFRTPLADFALDLLDFIDEKINEAVGNQTSRQAALSEAMGAIPVMKDRLMREDQVKLTQLMLIGFFDQDLPTLAALPEDDFARQTDEIRRRHEAARSVLAGGTTKIQK